MIKRSSFTCEDFYRLSKNIGTCDVTELVETASFIYKKPTLAQNFFRSLRLIEQK